MKPSYCVAFLRQNHKTIPTVGRLSNFWIDQQPSGSVNLKPNIPQTLNLTKQKVEGGIYFPELDKFSFANGVDVSWKSAKVPNETLTEKVKVLVGDEFKIQSDIIQIDNRFNTKLAVSIAISRSVLLDSLENLFETYLRETKSVVEGTKSISRSEIQKLIGKFMQLRYMINLSNTPYAELADFTWNDLSSEKTMKETFRYFDIYARVSSMNRKLDYASEIASLLNSKLTEKHGFRLEWIIIILIALEFALSLSQEYRHHKERTK
eukprot:NODE_20_length_44879_cov_0.624654.p20 type:complete len:264 gc:universal NODE_20_length_44879_cov_0.624654:33238-34029(+)